MSFWGFLVIVELIFLSGSMGQFQGNSSMFVNRCRKDCVMKKNGFVCTKYRVVRWLRDIAEEKEFSYGSLKVIKIPSMQNGSFLPQVSKPRFFKAGMDETLTFARDIAEELLTKRALVYTITHTPGAQNFLNGPLVVGEDEISQIQKGQTVDARLFKKKKALILPIVILVELLKLKLMMIPIFLGIHFIKKILVVASLALPAVLTKLKICKVPHYPPHHLWATAAESPVDYPTGYGHDNDVQGHYGGGFSSLHNPYSGYFQGR